MDRWYAQFALFNQINARGQQLTSRRVATTASMKWWKIVRCPRRPGRPTFGAIRWSIWAPGRAPPAGRTIRCACWSSRRRSMRSDPTARATPEPAPATAGCIAHAPTCWQVPAEAIALLYQFRYQIELFFRFFKCLLGCRHLISQHRQGIEIQVYCAVIACMLLNLYSGAGPTSTR